MSDQHCYSSGPSYNVPTLRYGPLTPYITTYTKIRKSLMRYNIHKLYLCL